MSTNRQTINDDQDYSEAIIKIAQSAEEMTEQVIGRRMRMDVITVFSATEEEHDLVRDYLLRIGEKSKLSHGSTTYVTPKNTKEVNGYRIKILGVRAPDITRTERGYVDFPVGNYSEINQELGSNPFVHEIVSGRGRKMLEIVHPEFDVRAYIVSIKDHL